MTTHPIASNENVETATSVFSAIYYGGEAFPDESLNDQMRRAMRSALLSIASHTAQDKAVSCDVVADGFIWKDGHHYEHVGYGPMPAHKAANARPFAFLDTLAASPQLPVAQNTQAIAVEAAPVDLSQLETFAVWPFARGIHSHVKGKYVLLDDVKKLLAAPSQGVKQ